MSDFSIAVCFTQKTNRKNTGPLLLTSGKGWRKGTQFVHLLMCSFFNVFLKYPSLLPLYPSVFSGAGSCTNHCRQSCNQQILIIWVWKQEALSCGGSLWQWAIRNYSMTIAWDFLFDSCILLEQLTSAFHPVWRRGSANWPLKHRLTVCKQGTMASGVWEQMLK